MKLTFTQNFGNRENVNKLVKGLTDAELQSLVFKTIGESITVSSELAAKVKAALPGAVEVSA